MGKRCLQWLSLVSSQVSPRLAIQNRYGRTETLGKGKQDMTILDRSFVAVAIVFLASQVGKGGVDMASCPNCKRVFQISYKVDEIRDVTEDIKKMRNK